MGYNLLDSFNRKIDYLRISLTDRCNLRCFYCAPLKIKLFDKSEVLTLEEIEYIVHFFYRYFGIKKVRFTGGEPLLRKGVENLIGKLRDTRTEGKELDINITTNGILLKENAQFLKEKNIKVNVSLDTLNSEKFKRITGFGNLNKVIEGIDFALDIGIPMKINTVILKGINDAEIFNLINFAQERRLEIRFIEYMPLSGNGEWRKFFVPERKIIERLKERYRIKFLNSEKIARIYEIYPKTRIGFISTISTPFCNYCSRLRITSDGRIVLCLFDEFSYSIREFLRPKIKEKELIKFIIDKVKFKPRGFIEYKKPVNRNLVMRKIGG